MDLNEIYSTRRIGGGPSQSATRTAFQRDYDRIIFSSAFRRLQNKTQVFPLPGSVFVHNRLTHSLEVSSVGRSLGNMIGERIATAFKGDLNEESRNFYLHDLDAVVAAACLCHDIGNPAFGHSGEDAIASYFERNETELKPFFKEKQWADLVNFEGNSNAIRVLTQQQPDKTEGGLKLTATTLASIAKYPCESVAKDPDKKDIRRKKFGFFQNEKETFFEMVQYSGMQQVSEDPLVFKRHPFVWLVEAADDICYNIIDMEDAHRLGIVGSDACEALFLSLIETVDAADLERVENRLVEIQNANDRISYLRAKTINALINGAVEIYWQNFDRILEGTLNEALLDIFAKACPAMNEIEAFSIKNIYRHRSVVEIENAGYNVMYELLDHFVPPVLKEKSALKNYDKMALRLIPDQFIYPDATLYQKVLGVVDFISGMRDNFATDLYRKIKGIEIGMTM